MSPNVLGVKVETIGETVVQGDQSHIHEGGDSPRIFESIRILEPLSLLVELANDVFHGTPYLSSSGATAFPPLTLGNCGLHYTDIRVK
jgi:hypothetical protein